MFSVRQMEDWKACQRRNLCMQASKTASGTITFFTMAAASISECQPHESTHHVTWHEHKYSTSRRQSYKNAQSNEWPDKQSDRGIFPPIDQPTDSSADENTLRRQRLFRIAHPHYNSTGRSSFQSTLSMPQAPISSVAPTRE